MHTRDHQCLALKRLLGVAVPGQVDLPLWHEVYVGVCMVWYGAALLPILTPQTPKKHDVSVYNGHEQNVQLAPRL